MGGDGGGGGGGGGGGAGMLAGTLLDSGFRSWSAKVVAGGPRKSHRFPNPDSHFQRVLTPYPVQVPTSRQLAPFDCSRGGMQGGGGGGGGGMMCARFLSFSRLPVLELRVCGGGSGGGSGGGGGGRGGGGVSLRFNFNRLPSRLGIPPAPLGACIDAMRAPLGLRQNLSLFLFIMSPFTTQQGTLSLPRPFARLSRLCGVGSMRVNME